jgi:CheY-like chemotaxis protein
LELEGCEVQVATDAESGIELARTNKPDVILMDIQLPGMDGLNATSFIKNDEALKSIPVIALTAHAMQGDKEKALGVGCIGYITKPVSTRNFCEQIKSLMNSNTV